jgi:hypothetical protein
LIALSFKNIIFLLICGLFGFFSTPTPDSITIIEISIAFLLVVFISPINIINSIYSFSSKIYNGSWFALIVFILLINLTFIGFFNGVYFRENGIYDFVRDFIPILYLLIPFFLFSNIENSDELERDNLIKLVCIGLLIISMGYIYQFISGDNFNINAIGVSLILGDSLDNIMQDPSITFGLMYSFGMMIYFLDNKKLFNASLFIVPQLLILTCLFASVLRAPIGLFIMLSLFFITKMLVSKKKYMILMSGSLLIPFLIVSNLDIIESLFSLIVDKNDSVGLSGRDTEIMTVISSIENSYDLIFGFGLGATLPDIHSYGSVRYTHNFFVFILMKFGLLGLITFCIVVYKSINVFIISILFSNTNTRNFITMTATVAPLIISLFFEPMYKSLSFGLVILLITIIGVDHVKRIPHK